MRFWFLRLFYNFLSRDYLQQHSSAQIVQMQRCAYTDSVPVVYDIPVTCTMIRTYPVLYYDSYVGSHRAIAS